MSVTRSAVTGSVVGAFPNAEAARACADALRAAGVPSSAIQVAGGATRVVAPAEREAPFLGRLVLIVVAWSIVGAVAGAIIGLALNAAGIGPGGAAGLGIQIGAWAIFAHMIAGMWAGYALLTSGESRRPAHRPGGASVVRVHCDEASCAPVAARMREAGATAVASYDASGRRLANS